MVYHMVWFIAWFRLSRSCIGSGLSHGLSHGCVYRVWFIVCLTGGICAGRIMAIMPVPDSTDKNWPHVVFIVLSVKCQSISGFIFDAMRQSWSEMGNRQGVIDTAQK